MATNYPIILVHGLFLKSIGRRPAFGKIADELTAAGYRVYIADHDGVGTIENNAAQLKTFVARVQRETGAPRVNLIAHSKGGLDSLYMVDRLGMADAVASLTFLCTPHKGSIIADKIYGLPRPLRAGIAHTLDFCYKLMGDTRPNSLKACRQLKRTQNGTFALLGTYAHGDVTAASTDGSGVQSTTVQAGSSLHRNATCDRTYLQSYSTTLARGRDDISMALTLHLSRRFENLPTDGLVSTPSSKFGTYRGNCTTTSTSHSQIVDYKAGKEKQAEVYAFYRNLCKELADMGY